METSVCSKLISTRIFLSFVTRTKAIFRILDLGILKFIELQICIGGLHAKEHHESKVALFDLMGNNFAIRVPFNRRSWVTRLPKIFQKTKRMCFFAGRI